MDNTAKSIKFFIKQRSDTPSMYGDIALDGEVGYVEDTSRCFLQQHYRRKAEERPVIIPPIFSSSSTAPRHKPKFKINDRVVAPYEEI